MKFHTILFTACLAATLLIQPSSNAQDAPDAPDATPPAPATPGATPKFAPDKMPPGEGRKERRSPEERLARLKKALGLTAEQETKIRDIYKTEADKIRAERQANKGAQPDPVERRKKMKELRDEIETQVNAVLTPEQKTKWETMKKDYKPRGPKTEVPTP